QVLAPLVARDRERHERDPGDLDPPEQVGDGGERLVAGGEHRRRLPRRRGDDDRIGHLAVDPPPLAVASDRLDGSLRLDADAGVGVALASPPRTPSKVVADAPAVPVPPGVPVAPDDGAERRRWARRMRRAATRMLRPDLARASSWGTMARLKRSVSAA